MAGQVDKSVRTGITDIHRPQKKNGRAIRIPILVNNMVDIMVDNMVDNMVDIMVDIMIEWLI